MKDWRHMWQRNVTCAPTVSNRPFGLAIAGLVTFADFAAIHAAAVRFQSPAFTTGCQLLAARASRAADKAPAIASLSFCRVTGVVPQAWKPAAKPARMSVSIAKALKAAAGNAQQPALGHLARHHPGQHAGHHGHAGRALNRTNMFRCQREGFHAAKATIGDFLAM